MPETGPTNVPQIDYDALLAAYRESLVTVLRGFSAGPAFLEAWVPDEDPVRSVVSVVEAAREAGLAGLELDVSPGSVDVEGLKASLASTAGITSECLGTKIRLHVELKELASPCQFQYPFTTATAIRDRDPRSATAIRDRDPRTAPDRLPDSYRERLERLVPTLEREGDAVTAREGLECLEAHHGALRLVAWIDPATARIAHARHSGACDPTERELLDLLCRRIEGTTLQEASDHSGLALEFALRDPEQPRPVSGIVHPNCVSRAFEMPLALVRARHTAESKQTGLRSTENFFVASPSERWKSMSRTAREARLREELDEKTTLVEIEGVDRVIVAIDPSVPRQERPGLLLDVEARLRRRVESSLQVLLEPRHDQNRVRQAVGVAWS